MNGRTLPKRQPPPGVESLEARLPRKRRAAVAGYVFRSEEPLDEQWRGIAVSTLGKVIRRGWEWLALTPDAHDRRAVAARAESYHLALTVGLSLAPLAAEPGATHGFVTAFLAGWGEALERDGRRARGKRVRSVTRDSRTRPA